MENGCCYVLPSGFFNLTVNTGDSQGEVLVFTIKLKQSNSTFIQFLNELLLDNYEEDKIYYNKFVSAFAKYYGVIYKNKNGLNQAKKVYNEELHTFLCN